MLIFVAVFADTQPFHAGRKVIRFIDGVIEDRGK